MADLRQFFLCQTGCFQHGFMSHPHFQQTAGNFELAFITAFLSALLEALTEAFLYSFRGLCRGGSVPSFLFPSAL
ncbi:TPA: hypothetical protein ACW331_004479, partial [Salmonella enterica subsp. enterica]